MPQLPHQKRIYLIHINKFQHPYPYSYPCSYQYPYSGQIQMVKTRLAPSFLTCTASSSLIVMPAEHQTNARNGKPISSMIEERSQPEACRDPATARANVASMLTQRHRADPPYQLYSCSDRYDRSGGSQFKSLGTITCRISRCMSALRCSTRFLCVVGL